MGLPIVPFHWKRDTNSRAGEDRETCEIGVDPSGAQSRLVLRSEAVVFSSLKPYKVTPMKEGKEGTGDERSSPGTNSSGGALPDASYTAFEMGSEDYEYEDDDEDLGQVCRRRANAVASSRAASLLERPEVSRPGSFELLK